MQPVYHAPEQELVYTAMNAPTTRASDLLTDAQTAKTALHHYANTCDDLRRRRNTLVSEFATFEASDHGDPDDVRDETRYFRQKHSYHLRAQAIGDDRDEAQRTCANALKKIGAPALPASSCEPSTLSYSGEAEGTVSSLNAGGNGKVTVKEVRGSDGKITWVVDVENGAHFGVHTLTGVKGGPEGSVSAEAKAAYTLLGRKSYPFTSRHAADVFARSAATEMVKNAAANATGPFSGPIKWTLDRFMGEAQKPPTPLGVFAEFGGQASMDASSESTLDAAAGASGAVILGLGITRATETEPEQRTFYMKGTGALNAHLKLGDYGGGPDISGDVTVAVTYADGETGPLSVKFEKSGTVQAGPDASFKSGGVTLGSSTKGTSTVEFITDTKHPENRAAVANALHKAGIPLLKEYGAKGNQVPQDAIDRLVARSTEKGPDEGVTYTKETSVGSKFEISVDLVGGQGETNGVGGKIVQESTSTTESYYYDRSKLRMVKRDGCTD